MTKVVTAPESVSVGGFRVFLAGAIDMGEAENWQNAVIQTLASYDDDLVLINPRRDQFTPDTLDEQVEWELEALELVECIAMWLPNTSKAPVSFWEAGYNWRSPRFIIGAGPQFYRRRNLEIAGERYDVVIFESLMHFVHAIIARYNNWKANPGDIPF